MKNKCSECGAEFYPYRDRPYGQDAQTCGKPECQRKRKTRLQRERRDAGPRCGKPVKVPSWYGTSGIKTRPCVLPLGHKEKKHRDRYGIES